MALMNMVRYDGILINSARESTTFDEHENFTALPFFGMRNAKT